ncbi:MAG: leucine-rich repeat-containing protein kinase family protein [Pontibacterium sp.]
MHTLSALKSGQLAGATRLTLSEGLTKFPMEILSLADSLEILDLSNNQLTEMPPEVAQLKRLKIFFASNNPFETVPAVLGQCESLEMVGFKSNKIKHLPAEALPAKLRWLILTNNQLETLPNELGERPRLQKLALAGNQLRELPQTLSQCHQLELIRISANQLTQFPKQLLELPKLAWFAFAGNPFCQSSSDTATDIPQVSKNDLILHQVLGQGASGLISEASWVEKQNHFPERVAVKVFKGEITSDGYPQDELDACLSAGQHPNLVTALAQVNEPDFLAVVMPLIPANYANLGLPPNFDTCTRDTFPAGFELGIEAIVNIVHQMTDVFEHLHGRSICHGDLYAHNTLFNEEGHIIFGDFGAASVYSMLSHKEQAQIKQVEQRALGYFIEDLLSICTAEGKSSQSYVELQAHCAAFKR